MALFAQVPSRNLESPYYIFARSGNQHIDLSNNWLLTSENDTIQNLTLLSDNEWFDVSYPTSVQMAHFYSGKLGNPYVNANALDHEILEQKAWYYKRNFNLESKSTDEYLLLCFDGIDYFAKVWVNGEHVGQHEGIFGGPSIDVTNHLVSGQNEIIVEVLSANFGTPNFEARKPGKIVKGWFLSGGTGMEPFFNLGLWQGVRLEKVNKYHMERPFLYTESIDDEGHAKIGFSMEIFSGKNSLDYELHPWRGQQLVSSSYIPTKPNIVDDDITVTLIFKDNDEVAYTKTFKPHIIEGRSFMEETFELAKPKLWYPNGLGEPDFYQVQIILQRDEKPIDIIDIDFGVRTISQVRSAGIRTTDRWHDWQFVVNGKKFFLKGINWMPVDALYDLTPDKYDWAVKMAKSAGIQMFRIWGSGLMETKAFYSACNKYGIMVWQDFNIANFDTPEWPQHVFEAQVCQNIFRLRNEPSLAVWCGGNEHNPYSLGNATSTGIIERNLSFFDPTRMFVRASPDGGSLHLYPDFDPKWYRAYDLAPMIAETGIHSITDSKGIREVVNHAELTDLGGMYEDSFAKSHPEFVMHFAEYEPSRVPRMLSRASHIADLTNPAIEEISEATQVAAGEFYQIMAEGIQANYPITTGLMPWVYKRPWPVVAAIHLVDGFGQPSAPYYFLKRTYLPTRVTLQVDRLIWGPGESFPMQIKVLNSASQAGFDGKVHVQIYDDTFKPLWQSEGNLSVQKDASVNSLELPSFKIPNNYRQKYFFVLVSLYNSDGNLISQADYWPRTIPQMEDLEYREKYINGPTVWPTLDNGPFLKTTVSSSWTDLNLRLDKLITDENGNHIAVVSVENTGRHPSFMTQFEIEGVSRLFFAEDNFFWLHPGENRQIQMTIKFRDEVDHQEVQLVVSSWNADAKKVTLKIKI